MSAPSEPSPTKAAASPLAKVLQNFAALGVGEVASRLLAFGAITYLARVLGPTAFGVFTLAVQVSLYFTKIADFGIEFVGSREVAHRDEGVPRLIGALLTARLLLTSLLTLLLVGACYLFLDDPERTVFVLAFLVLVPIAANTKFVHMGHQRAQPVGVSRGLGELAGLALVLGLVHGPADLWVAPLSRVLAEGFMTIWLIVVLFRSGYGFRLRYEPEVSHPVMRKAFPLMLQIILALLTYNADSVMLGIMEGPTSVGYYGTAYTLVSFLANMSMVYASSLLPALTSERRAHPEKAASLYRSAMGYSYALALPACIGAYVLAPSIILLVFGDGYEQSITVLQILIWSVGLAAVRNVPWAGLVAFEKQTLLTKATGAAAALNLVLNLVLIPKYSIHGAAIATVCTEAPLLLVSMRMAAKEGLPVIELRRLLRPTVAAAVMAVAIDVVPTPNVAVTTLLGVAVFFGAFAATGGVRRDDGRWRVKM